jgi:ComF family protein
MSNWLRHMSLRLPKFSSLAALGRDCLLCAGDSSNEMICMRCVSSLPLLAHDEGHPIAPFEYRFPVDRLVQRFKFAGDLAVGQWLSVRLAASARTARRPDVLIPVPLTNARLRERGFNQAAQIARTVSRQLAIPASLRVLERVREAPAQSALGRRARRANLRGAFACRRRLDGRHVALIDDVVTTGATAEAASRALKRAGATRVDVWAIARTPDPWDR